MPLAPKPFLLWNLILQPPRPLKARSSATSHYHQQNPRPTPSLFPHTDHFWTIPCVYDKKSLSPSPRPQLQRELGKRIFLISTLGRTWKDYSKGTDHLKTWQVCSVTALRLEVEVFVCFNTVVSPHCKAEVYSSSLSRQALVKIKWHRWDGRIPWNPISVSTACPPCSWRLAGSPSIHISCPVFHLASPQMSVPSYFPHTVPFAVFFMWL